MADLNIISEKQNLLFKRKEIVATLDAEITPNKTDVEKLISEEFSTSPEKFVLKYIKGKFGSKTFEVRINIYETEEEKQSIEVRKKKEKKK